MAENLELQLAENLFGAIDRIATKKIENLQYDKTLTCQIIDANNSNKGEYIVSDGVTDFIAYSENSSYSEGTWVYVSIPNGDFNQQKHIVGKYVADNTEYSTYKNPLDSYIDITGNLLDLEDGKEFGLIANKNDEPEIILWRIGSVVTDPSSSSIDSKEVYAEKIRKAIVDLEADYERALNVLNERHNATDPTIAINDTTYNELLEQLNKYHNEKQQSLENELNFALTEYKEKKLSFFNRLGIQADFKTLLNKYNLEKGHYGLRLDIAVNNPTAVANGEEVSYFTINLSNDTMFGNPYNFFTWSKQQYVFDISELGSIIGMQLVFYQSNDFQNSDGNYIPGYESLPDERTRPEYPGDDADSTILDQWRENVAIWDAKYKQLENQWQAYYSMKNILVKDIYISLGYDLADFDTDSLLLYSYDSLTYSSSINNKEESFINEHNAQLQEGETPIDLSTPEGFQRGLNLINSKNIYLRWIHLDPDTGEIKAVDDINDLPWWKKDDEDEESEGHPLAKIHWYRWNMKDGVSSKLAGTFWEEVNINQLHPRKVIEQTSGGGNITYDDTTNTYDWFEYEGMIPDVNKSSERYKVIIEYPCRDYLEYSANATVNEYIDQNRDTWLTEIVEALVAETVTTTDAQGNQTTTPVYGDLEIEVLSEIKLEEKIKTEKENYRNSILAKCVLYTSPEIVFNNEQEVQNEATIDAIRGLELFCDEDGYKGIYRIYNADGALLNRNDAARFRILEARFNEVITEANNETVPRVQNIRWYFPTQQTMIKVPVEGYEWSKNDGTTFAGVYNSSTVIKPEDETTEGKLPAGLPVECNGSWFVIERQGLQMTSSGERQIGDIIFNSLTQTFRIEDIYRQSASNNTIKCEVYKDGKSYLAEITLHFGTTGSNGTDYTLTVEYEEAKYQYELNEDGSTKFNEETGEPIIKYITINNEDGTTTTVPDYEWKPMGVPVFYRNRKTPIRLVPHVFDYESRDITDQFENAIHYSDYSHPVTNYQGLIWNQDGKYCVIQRNSEPYQIIQWQDDNGNIVAENTEGATQVMVSVDPEPQSFYHYIIQLTVQNSVQIRTPRQEGDDIVYPETGLSVNLNTYCPIAVKFSEDYLALDGDNRITYDSSGTNPIYYKNPYVLYKTNKEKIINVKWLMDLGNEIIGTSITPYYPQIGSTTGILAVPAIYMRKIARTISIIATELVKIGENEVQSINPETNELIVTIEPIYENKLAWCQPIYIAQDIYSSSFLNSWDGSLNIDSDKNTIMSAMIGAGQKGDNNLFDGVLMGVVNNVFENNDVGIGLFGFNAGDPSFGLNIDGTAFFGKQGSGRIEFNGNSGIIKSGTYDQNDKKGMLIDLDDGFIHIKGNEGIIKDGNLSNYPLVISDSFSVDWNGSMFATSGSVGGWQISPFGLFSDQIQEGDSNFTGIALYGAKPGDTDESLRILVGSIELENAYFIDYGSKPAVVEYYPLYDDEGNQEVDPNTGQPLYEMVIVESAYLSGVWTKVDKNTYDADSSHEKYIDPTYPSASSYNLPSFKITKGGKLTANQALFPVATITNATIGTLVINGALYLSGWSYTRRGLTVVTNVTRRKNEQLNVYTRTFYYLGTDPSAQSRKTVKV